MFFLMQEEYKKITYNIKGFSFLDLVVAMSIMAILACLAVPRIIYSNDMQLNYEAIKLVNKIRDAQSKAITRHSGDNAFASITNVNCDYIYTTTNSYQISCGLNNMETVYLPNGITIIRKIRYTFNNYGAGSYNTIRLKNDRQKIDIIIDTAGRVRIEK